jgi:hypothetical protein
MVIGFACRLPTAVNRRGLDLDKRGVERSLYGRYTASTIA